MVKSEWLQILATVLLLAVVSCSHKRDSGAGVRQAEKSSHRLQYYGGYFNKSLHWHNRIITEYTNLTRVSGSFDDYLRRSSWLLRSRAQRIQYDLQYELDLGRSDNELLEMLQLRRRWLELTNLLDSVDMLFIDDEPWARNKSDKDLQRLSVLVRQVFPGIKQVVVINPQFMAGHSLPDTIDIVGIFAYAVRDNPGSEIENIRNQVRRELDKVRDAGIAQPVIFIGQAAAEVAKGGRMPTPEETQAYLDIIEELNEIPKYNVIGFQWYHFQGPKGGWAGVDSDCFRKHAHLIAVHRDFGQSRDFTQNKYAFVDLFEAEPEECYDYRAGGSIHGINGWTVDYQSATGQWYAGSTTDSVVKEAVIDGRWVSRSVGPASKAHRADPPAARVVFSNHAIGLDRTKERYVTIDVVGRLTSTVSSEVSTVTVSIEPGRDAATSLASLTLSSRESAKLVLPVVKSNRSMVLNKLPGKSDFPFALRFVFDTKQGRLDILDMSHGVVLIAKELRCHRGPITQRPNRLVVDYHTAPHSIFDLDAVQAFSSSAYPEPDAT